MSNLNENDIALILGDTMEIIDYHLDCKTGYWQMLVSDPVKIDGEIIDERDWRACRVTDVPVDYLIREYEGLINELSSKEVKLYSLKEAYLIAEDKIVRETDFKALYGANNQKVRDNHVKNELADMVTEMKGLEFGMNWIRNYIPFLREVIRSKRP